MPVFKIKNKDGSWQEVAGVSGHSHSVSQIVDFPDMSGFATEEYVATQLASKVDKEDGKALSSNDYTDAEKSKLNNIEDGANKTIVDSTLTQSGQAADAKVVGDAVGGIFTDMEKSLLLDLLYEAAYTSNQSERLIKLRDIWQKIEKVHIDNVIQGLVSYPNNKATYSYNGWLTRATIEPVCQYLIKGRTYRFCVSDDFNYQYGIFVFRANSSGLEWEAEQTENGFVLDGLIERIVDTGWINTEYSYTPTDDDLVLSINFRKQSNYNLTYTDYQNILSKFTIEVI